MGKIYIAISIAEEDGNSLPDFKYEVFSTEERAKERLLQWFEEDKRCDIDETIIYTWANPDGKVYNVEKKEEWVNSFTGHTIVKNYYIHSYIEEKELQ